MKSDYDRANKLWEFMDAAEERAFYEEVLDRVANNPRFYLDHLDELSVFRTRFQRYYAEKDLLNSYEP